MFLSRLLALFSEDFDQPALRAIRVLRPLKLVTGFESKWPQTFVSTWSSIICIFIVQSFPIQLHIIYLYLPLPPAHLSWQTQGKCGPISFFLHALPSCLQRSLNPRDRRPLIGSFWSGDHAWAIRAAGRTNSPFLPWHFRRCLFALNMHTKFLNQLRSLNHLKCFKNVLTLSVSLECPYIYICVNRDKFVIPQSLIFTAWRFISLDLHY